MVAVLNTNDTDLKYMALTVYGEARGEPLEGKIAVANVIKNRSIRRKQSIYDVVLAPYQFSCWLESDPNRQKLDNVLSKWERFVEHDELIRECLWVCFGVLNGLVSDNTNGADHYVARWLLASNKAPSWTKELYVSAIIGKHIFYDSTRRGNYG